MDHLVNLPVGIELRVIANDIHIFLFKFKDNDLTIYTYERVLEEVESNIDTDRFIKETEESSIKE